MDDVFELPPGHRAAVAPLFEHFRELPAILGAVFDGGLGVVTVDDPARPRVARLLIGCYAAFGGDPGALRAGELVRSVPPPRELVYGGDPAWRRLCLEIHGDALTDHPNATFDGSRLDSAELRAKSELLPPGFAMARFDAELAEQLDADLEPHALQVFPSAAAFADAGFGFAARIDGRLASVATSYAIGRGSAEVAIATRAADRGRGLAFAVAARFLLHCLEVGLAPEWNASNPISQRLALRLGYRRRGSLEDLLLR
jgi:RimJ/RimL family protein N-acetyltransferase